MTVGEVGFVIQKDDETIVVQPGGRRSKRKGKPWTTWAAAQKFNTAQRRVNVSGIWSLQESPPIGKVKAVQLVLMSYQE